jgi:hypothetical protein
MSSDAIADFLANHRDEAPEELQGLILEFEDLWERKLWHQLTDKLIEFFDNPASTDLRLEFYKVFIIKFADKLNQLKLVELALKTLPACQGECPLQSARKPKEVTDRLFRQPREVTVPHGRREEGRPRELPRCVRVRDGGGGPGRARP